MRDIHPICHYERNLARTSRSAMDLRTYISGAGKDFYWLLNNGTLACLRISSYASRASQCLRRFSRLQRETKRKRTTRKPLRQCEVHVTNHDSHHGRQNPSMQVHANSKLLAIGSLGHEDDGASGGQGCIRTVWTK